MDRKRYNTILIDPPWEFNTYSEKGKAFNPDRHYPTMQKGDLEALDMQSIMAEDCSLFMWACWPSLPQALTLGATWGVEYKTCAFLWAKTTRRKSEQGVMFGFISDPYNWHMGMGYWTRANTEPCLLFTKGNPKRKSANIRQLVVSAVRRHSQKPDMIYSHIESLVDGDYCEIFARQRWAGWDAIGNEIDGRDIRQVLAKTPVT